MGLLRGVARTAVVAGTASAVSGASNAARPSSSQIATAVYDNAARPTRREPRTTSRGRGTAAASGAGCAPEDQMIAQLEQLADCRPGDLDDDEFTAAKAKLIAAWDAQRTTMTTMISKSSIPILTPRDGGGSSS